MAKEEVKKATSRAAQKETPKAAPKEEVISAKTMEKIREKAEKNEALMAPTAAKQAAYDRYQQSYTDKITTKARDGEKLSAPNEWKDGIYADARANARPGDNAYYEPDVIAGRQPAKEENPYFGAEAIKGRQEGQTQTDPRFDPDTIMQRSTAADKEQFEALQRMMGQWGQSSMQSQEAILSQTRDAQIAEIQKALEDAVAEGKISTREAQSQFDSGKKEIEKEAYRQMQSTKLQSQNRGISNSQQMLGLQQGDNSRKLSMLNENLTTRDKRVNDIKDRLDSIKNKSAIDTSTANATFGYGKAAAQGNIDSQVMQQMFQAFQQNAQANKQNQFQLDSAGMQHAFQQQLMDKQFGQNMDMTGFQDFLQQAMMDKQFGQNLDMAGLQQMFQKQIMDKQFGHDNSMADKNQGFTQSNMDKQFGHDKNMADKNQGFTQSNMDKQFGHDKNMSNQQHTQNKEMTSINFANQLKAMDRTQKYTLDQFAAKLNIDLKLMDAGQQHELQKMATQHGFNVTTIGMGQDHDKSMLSLQQTWQGSQAAKDREHSMTMAINQQNAAYQSAIDEYQVALDREYSKHTDPKSKEYKIEQEQKKKAMEDYVSKNKLDLMTQAEISAMSGKPPKNPGKAPVRKDFNKFWQGKKAEDKAFKAAEAVYKAELKAYNDYNAIKEKYNAAP